MKYFLVFLSLLMLTPFVSADITIRVPNQIDNTNVYANQATQTYNFNLLNPPFNTTAVYPNFTNNSIYQATINSQFIDQEYISDNRHYEIIVVFNSTHTYKMQYTYEKHGYSFLSYYNAYYSLQKDGAEICNYQNHLSFSESISPSPSFLFDWNLRGSYNSVEFLDGSTSQISGEVIHNNPSLHLSFSDSLMGSGTDRLSFISQSPCPATTIGGAIFDFDVVEMTSSPSVTFLTYSNSLFTHVLNYHFQNKTTEIAEATFEVTSINEKIASCSFLQLGNFCGSELFIGLFKLIFDIASWPILFILSKIPGLTNLKDVVYIAISSFVSVGQTIFQFLLLTGPNFGIGGVLIFFLTYNLTLGLLIFSFSQNPFHIIALPYFFLYAYVYIIIALTYGLFFWLPIKIYELAVNIAQAIRG
jgi:hypothetical protein